MLFGLSSHIGVGLTSILTQDVGIFLRQNRVRMCALWLSNSCTNPAREKNDNPSVTAAPCHLPLHKGAYVTQPFNFSHQIRGQTKTCFCIFYDGAKTKQKNDFIFSHIRKNNRHCSVRPPLCKGRWHGAAVTEGLSFFFPSHSIKQQTVEPCAKNFSVI